MGTSGKRSRAYLLVAFLLFAATAEATQKNLPSTYVNTHGCSLGVSPCEIELTDLAISDVITGPSDDVRFVLYNLNVGPTGTSSNQTQIRLRMTKDGVTLTSQTFTMPVSTQISIQLSQTLTGLSIGSHSYQFYVTQNTSSQVSYTTSSYSMVAALNVGATTAANTPTPLATIAPQPTSTPLAFNTPGKIAIFGTAGNNLQPYAGSTPCSGYVTTISPSGATTCATPIPTPTAGGGGGGTSRMFTASDTSSTEWDPTSSSLFGLFGHTHYTTVTSQESFNVIRAGSFAKLQCVYGNFDGVAVTGAQTVTCALVGAGGAGGPLSCTITAASPATGLCSGYAVGHCCSSFTAQGVVVGDFVQIQVTGTNSVPAHDLQFSTEFDPS